MNADNVVSPLVSICIPTYNMARFVGPALESALAQTYPNLEILVSDNASSDDTAAVLSRYHDSRLEISRNSVNLGPVGNFNKLIVASRGKWIKFLEADDLLKPECVGTMVAAASGCPSVGIVCCARTLIGPSGELLGFTRKGKSRLASGSEILKQAGKNNNEIGTPTDVLAKREILMAAGLFDEGFGTYLNDFDLWLRCIESCDVALLEEPLVSVRRHPDQIGSVGSINNSDIDANLLMIRKRFSYAPMFSQRWRSGIAFTLSLSERFIWRGLYRAMRNIHRAPGSSRWDFMKKLNSNLGFGKVCLAAGYVFVRSPMFLIHQVREKQDMKRQLLPE
jgi:glycosyltransferase involved in cell wall biosynthesis